MLKLTLSAVLITVLSIPAFCQNTSGKFSFILSPQIAFPLGDLKNTIKLGLGGSFSGEFSASDKMRIPLTLERIGFIQKDVDFSKNDSMNYPLISATSITAGVKYFLTNNLFLTGKGGIVYHVLSEYQETNFGFVFSPILGYQFGQKRYGISVKYVSTRLRRRSINLFGFSIGYYL